jgi:hypothetical protein
MEVKPNECSVCTDVIKDGEEYHECTNPINVENPHKVCEDCYQGLKKGYDYDEEILDPQALLPSPRLNADGTPMRDARGNPIMMSRDELIEFYKTQKHASHGEGCPMKDGNLVKKTMGQPKQSVTLRVMDKPAAARGGIHYDSEDELLNKAIKMSLEPSRPGAAAAAAAVNYDDYDDDLRRALLASQQETIQQIHRQLNQRGIRVSEEYVRRIFQQMSALHPKGDPIVATEDYLVKNPPPPPPAPFYPQPPPPYVELLRNQELYPQLRVQRRLPGQPFQPPPLPSLPPGWQLLRNPDGVQFYAGPNGERTIDFPWNAYDAAQRRGGKKSKIIKSRKGKKSKIIKSRKGKKSKMTKSRRGKKSKMTRKKV